MAGDRARDKTDDDGSVLDVTLANVAVSALTSAVVALGVEWLAKPRLEARKERLLHRHRASADVRRQLDTILFDAGKLLHIRMPAGLKEDQRAIYVRELRETSDEILTATRALEDAQLDVMSVTSDHNIELLASYVGFVRGVMRSERTWTEKGDMIWTCTPIVMDVLGGRGQSALYWMRRGYRARRHRQATALLRGDPGEPGDHTAE